MSASSVRLVCRRRGARRMALAACTTNPPPDRGGGADGQPAIPSPYRPEEIVGRWGYGAFHKEEDLARGPALPRAANAASRSISPAAPTAAS